MPRKTDKKSAGGASAEVCQCKNSSGYTSNPGKCRACGKARPLPPQQEAEVAPLPNDLTTIKELLVEQFPRQRESAKRDKVGTSVLFIARGDYMGMFVVRNGEQPKERLYLCRILEVVDEPSPKS